MVEIRGEVFYGELLTAVMNKDLAKAAELLSKLNEDELESLWVACSIIRQMAKELWVRK